MAERKYDIPDEFLEAADKFVALANEMGENVSRDWVRAVMMYATARYNAFTWITRESRRGRPSTRPPRTSATSTRRCSARTSRRSNPCIAPRRERSRSEPHAGHRQQELLVLVAAPLAGHEARRPGVRRTPRAAQPAGHEGPDPAPLSQRPRAVPGRRRARGVGLAGDLRVRQRAVRRRQPLAARRGGARPRAVRDRRDALGLRGAAHPYVDGHPRAPPGPRGRRGTPGRTSAPTSRASSPSGPTA